MYVRCVWSEGTDGRGGGGSVGVGRCTRLTCVFCRPRNLLGN